MATRDHLRYRRKNGPGRIAVGQARTDGQYGLAMCLVISTRQKLPKLVWDIHMHLAYS